MKLIKRIVVLAPHFDDGEFGCGGSIAKWILNEQEEVYYIGFCHAKESIPKGMPKDILSKELMEATKILGIPKDNVRMLDYPVRRFQEFRQDILEDMVKIFSELAPHLVVLPSMADTHQDHQVIAQEGFRAFKRTSIMGYEVAYNNRNFNADIFVPLTEDELNLKIKAVKKYKSQFGRIYSTKEFIKGQAVVRGGQIGTEYAEAFSAVRIIYW